MKRKILSIFLTLVMTVAVLPAMAYGDEVVAKIDSTSYSTLEAALNAATSGKTVILQKDYTLTENVTVKSGVTLLIPYDPAEDTTGWGSSSSTWTGKDNESITSNTGFNGTLKCTLTIPESCEMTVNGNVLVNAVTGAKGTAYVDQDVTGAYGKMVVNGTVTLKNGGTLQNCGLITGNGMMTAENGSTVIDLYVIRHWRGGSAAYASKEAGIYPMNEIDCHYIQVPLKIMYGATFKGAVKIYTDKVSFLIAARFNKAHFTQIANSNGLIKLESGAYAIKTYDSTNKISTIDIYGGAKFASSSMKLSLPMMSLDLSTGDYLFPVDGDIAMNLHEGNYEVQNNFKLLPGFKANLDSDATLTIDSGKKLVFYDTFSDPFTPAKAGYNYGGTPRTSAELIVHGGAKVINNGTLAGRVVSADDATYLNYADFTVGANGVLSASTDEVVQITGSLTNGNLNASTSQLPFKAELWANGTLNKDISGDTGAEKTWYGLKKHWYSPLDKLDGDLDENGTVNYNDLAMLLENYNTEGSNLKGDIDLNGTVNYADLAVLLENYNKTIE